MKNRSFFVSKQQRSASDPLFNGSIKRDAFISDANSFEDVNRVLFFSIQPYFKYYQFF